MRFLGIMAAALIATAGVAQAATVSWSGVRVADLDSSWASFAPETANWANGDYLTMTLNIDNPGAVDNRGQTNQVRFNSSGSITLNNRSRGSSVTIGSNIRIDIRDQAGSDRLRLSSNSNSNNPAPGTALVRRSTPLTLNVRNGVLDSLFSTDDDATINDFVSIWDNITGGDIVSGVDGIVRAKNDGAAYNALTLQYTPVPLPPAGLALIAGLGVLGLMRRRKA